jgi:hypothetical protein
MAKDHRSRALGLRLFGDHSFVVAVCAVPATSARPQ